MALIDPLSDNFKRNGLWNRLLEHVGGDEKRAIQWWDTPIGSAPFLGRAPKDLMTEEEWDTVRIFLESRNPVSTAKFDYGPSNYYYTDNASVKMTESKRKRK